MRFLFLFALAAMASLPVFFHVDKTEAPKKPPVSKPAKFPGSNNFMRIQSHAAALRFYAAKYQYNARYCFLVDMKLPSGNNRFFVYDLKKDTVVTAGLVTHGYGNSSSSYVGFSNRPGSNSSSPGKYKIGAEYYGKFGLAFKLHGLDSSNSNAFNRFVVLHSHECVPEKEVAPQSICMSQGCPTVAPAFLNALKGYLETADKPVLLYIYN